MVKLQGGRYLTTVNNNTQNTVCSVHGEIGKEVILALLYKVYLVNGVISLLVDTVHYS